MPNAQTIRETFDRISDRYEIHAALEQEVGDRLLERTSFNRLAPGRILDLGCGTGRSGEAIKRQFRKAQVIGLDSSPAMLAQLCRRSGMMRPLKAVCGDMVALPFPANSIDMVISNLAAYWAPEPMQMYGEIHRVLRPDGMLLFSTLGPGTMAELSAAWAAVDDAVEFPVFPDLMDVGNALVAAGFREPVMDMEMITLRYHEPSRLFEELEATGKSLLVRGWGRWRQSLAELEQAWKADQAKGALHLSFEVIYGTAFGPREGQPMKTAEGDVATFSLESLRRSVHGGLR